MLSTPHPAAMTAALVGTQAIASAYVGAFQLPLVPEVVLSRTLGTLLRRSGLPPASADRYQRRMAEPGALSAALGWYRAIPLQPPAGPGRVAVPTTYLWGSADPSIRRRAAELTERHVDGPYRFEALEAGHWLPETRPDEVTQAVLSHAA